MREAQPGEPCYDSGRQRPIDVYLTEGSLRSLTAGGFARHLADALRSHQPAWHVVAPDAGTWCNKSGSTNQLGLLLNGHLPDPADAAHCPDGAGARAASGTFVHIEQLRCAGALDCSRSGPVRDADAWLPAIVAAYAAATGQSALPGPAAD